MRDLNSASRILYSLGLRCICLDDLFDDGDYLSEVRPIIVCFKLRVEPGLQKAILLYKIQLNPQGRILTTHRASRQSIAKYKLRCA